MMVKRWAVSTFLKRNIQIRRPDKSVCLQYRLASRTQATRHIKTPVPVMRGARRLVGSRSSTATDIEGQRRSFENAIPSHFRGDRLAEMTLDILFRHWSYNFTEPNYLVVGSAIRIVPGPAAVPSTAP